MLKSLGRLKKFLAKHPKLLLLAKYVEKRITQVMTQAIAEIAYYGGRGIAEARTPSQLDHALTALLDLPRLRQDAEMLGSHWQAASEQDPTFILSLARETSVSIGASALVLARYNPRQSIVDQTVESLGQFRNGLIQGGLGSRTSRALLGRALEEMTVERYNADGNAPLAAGRLELIGRSIKVFGWRERLEIGTAKAAHFQRHGMSASALDRLAHTVTQQLSQARDQAASGIFTKGAE